MDSITFLTYVTNLFSPEVILVVCALLCVYALIQLYLKKMGLFAIFNKEKFRDFAPKVKAVVIIATSTLIAAVVTITLKEIFKIPRPVEMIIVETGYSFPSAHSSVSFAFFTAVATVLHLFRRVRKGYLLLVIPVLVAISRVELHVHRVVDVVAGAAIGVLSVALVIRFYTWYTKTYAKV